MNKFIHLGASLALSALIVPAVVQAYPIDGYADTGIRRVEGVRLVEEGTIPGRKQPPGRPIRRLKPLARPGRKV